LEVLVHGITYNKEMWAGLNVEAGEEYNWHSFANRRGYHTLAIDRLGHGTNPERPDPFSVVEGPFQVEIMHQLITLLRTGSDNPLGRTFRRIAYVSDLSCQCYPSS
jgi:pimeloyl-ACP methyl ester carboxylesterase